MTKRPAYHQQAADHPDPLLDLCCWSCGYRLRGLAPEGACPECGSAIVESIFRTQSPFADLRAARIGAIYVVLATAAEVILLLGMTMIAMAFKPSAGWFFAASALLLGLYVFGAWLSTSKIDNTPAHLDRFDVQRRRSRRRILISSVMIVVCIFAILTFGPTFGGIGSITSMLSLWLMCQFIVIGEGTRLQYMGGLLDKLNIPRAATNARHLAIAVPIAGLLVMWSPVVLGLLGWLLGLPPEVSGIALGGLVLFLYINWIAAHVELISVISEEFRRT